MRIKCGTHIDIHLHSQHWAILLWINGLRYSLHATYSLNVFKGCEHCTMEDLTLLCITTVIDRINAQHFGAGNIDFFELAHEILQRSRPITVMLDVHFFSKAIWYCAERPCMPFPYKLQGSPTLLRQVSNSFPHQQVLFRVNIHWMFGRSLHWVQFSSSCWVLWSVESVLICAEPAASSPARQVCLISSRAYMPWSF